MSPARLLAAALLSLLLASPVLGEAARVRRDGAQLRAQTGFTGAVLASPATGARVEVLEVANEWRRVRTEDGREGWVHELFLDEGAAAVVAPRPPTPLRPGAKPNASAFEPPLVEERVEAAPAAELERLRQELLRERTARAQLQRDLEQARIVNEDIRANLSAIESRLERQEREHRAAEQRWRAAIDQAAENHVTDVAERERALRNAEEDRAAALRSLTEEHRAELAAVEARHEEELAEARSANAAEIAELQAKLRAEQDRVGERFVENCTELHQRELTRKEAEWAASCEERLGELNAAHQKELRKVSKQSGWEEEFDREVRQAVKEQVDERLAEAKLRWEAKHRGDAVELEKELKKLRAELEADCESRVLAAVTAEHERHRNEMNESLRALQAEEERRCKAALELVLQRHGMSAPPEPGELAEQQP